MIKILHKVLIYLGEIDIARSVHMLKSKFTDKVGRKILDFHSVDAHKKITTNTISCSIWSLRNGLLPLIIIHTELNQVHFLEDLEVHIDNLFAKGFTFQKAYELLLPHHSLKVFKNLSQLERVPLSEVFRELKWLVGISTEKELLVLFIPVLQYDVIIFQMGLLVVKLSIFRKLYKLISKHVVQELF